LAAKLLEFDDRRESPKDESLAIERHWIVLRRHARVLHDLFHTTISRPLVWPFDQREHHCFLGLRLHRATKIRQLALLDVVAPALENAGGAVLKEYRVGAARMLDELLFVSRGTAITNPST